MRAVVLALIRSYQKIISPLTGRNCRFYPSCSQYGYKAIDDHGFLKGFALLLRRLGKCHPWHPGGVDDVPAPRGRHPHG